jgi:AcrR family transcriptional regulator
MLMFMQALPGRRSRVRPDAPPTDVTRSSTHADQRRRILRAVGELVSEHGYGDVTVDKIVKRAHVSYKTFYSRFEGKEESFIALFDGVVRSAERAIRDRLEAESRPWPEQVVIALRTLVEQILTDPVLARVIIVDSPSVGPAIREHYEQAVKALVPFFREGRELNPRGAELPDTIEDTLAGSVFWSIYQRLVIGRAEEIPDLRPEMTEVVLRTYLGQAEASRIVRAEALLEPAAA